MNEEYIKILHIITNSKDEIIKYLTSRIYKYKLIEIINDIEYTLQEKEEYTSDVWASYITNNNITDISISITNLEQIIEKDCMIINDKYFYSAYGTIINIIDKEFVWTTQVIDQALLHPFNKNRLENIIMVQPIIYRFNIKPSNIVLVSHEKDNIDIFNKLLKPIINNIKAYYTKLDEDNNIFNNIYNNNIYNNNIFKGEKNYRILHILKALNTIISQFNITISGYYNYYDQDEYAFLNFNNIVDNIIFSNYISITYKNEDKINVIYNFPISIADYNIISGDGTKYTDIKPKFLSRLKYRMSCNNLINITYKNFDTDTPIIYNCKPDEEYFKNKYLKYKNKYLNYKMA